MTNLYMSDMVIVVKTQPGACNAENKIGHIISSDQARYLITQHNFEEYGIIRDVKSNAVYFLEAGTKHVWILGEPKYISIRSLNQKEIKTMTIAEIEAALGYSIKIQY